MHHLPRCLLASLLPLALACTEETVPVSSGAKRPGSAAGAGSLAGQGGGGGESAAGGDGDGVDDMGWTAETCVSAEGDLSPERIYVTGKLNDRPVLVALDDPQDIWFGAVEAGPMGLSGDTVLSLKGDRVMRMKPGHASWNEEEGRCDFFGAELGSLPAPICVQDKVREFLPLPQGADYFYRCEGPALTYFHGRQEVNPAGGLPVIASPGGNILMETSDGLAVISEGGVLPNPVGGLPDGIDSPAYLAAGRGTAQGLAMVLITPEGLQAWRIDRFGAGELVGSYGELPDGVRVGADGTARATSSSALDEELTLYQVVVNDTAVVKRSLDGQVELIEDLPTGNAPRLVSVR